MTGSLSKWAWRLLVLGIGLLTALVLVLATALIIFDEEDYREALVWAAETYLDVTLAIDGELSIEFGPTLALDAQGLGLQTNDGRFTASVTDLAAQLRLRPLLSKTVWLDSLTIVGARFDIRQRPDTPDDRGLGRPQGLPKVILQETRLLDVALAYRHADDAVHQARIDQLLIEEALDQGPVTVGGNGEINGQPVTVAGTLGSREQLLDTAAPFPLKLRLNSGTFSANLEGVIGDPIDGRGVDLRMSVNDPDLAASLGLVGWQVPPLGALYAKARVGGDYDALRFEKMQLSLQREKHLDVGVEGNIENIQAFDGLDLKLSGTIDDAKVWQWLTFGRLPGIKGGTFGGSLSDQTGTLRISDLTVETVSESDLRLGVEGEASIVPGKTPLTEPDIDLVLSLSAPGLTAIKALVDHDLPELGPVQLSTRVYGRLPLLRFEALDATVGYQNQHRFRFTNGTGQLDLQKEPKLQNARIPMTGTTPRPAGLSQLFGVDTPKLGRTTFKGTWEVDGPTIKLEQIDSTIQLTGGATHRLAGTIVRRIGQTTTANIKFDLDTDRVLALWTENTPGELGRLEGTIDLLQSKDTWRVRSLQLESTQTDLFKLNAAGEDGGPNATGPQQMDVRLQVDDPSKLFVTAGFGPLPFAPIKADGTLIHDRAQFRYRGTLHVGKTASQLQLATDYQGDRPSVSGQLNTPLLMLSDFGLSVEETQALRASTANNKPEAKKRNAAQQTKTLFSREPLDLAWMQAFDLDLSLRVDELRGADLKIDAITGRITLESGRLRLSQADFRYFGGEAYGYYEIDARAIPVYKVDVRVDDLALGKILKEFLPNTIKGGIMDLELKLEGRGQTAHQIASSLSGALDLAFEKSRIPSAYVEFLSADVLGWTLGRTALADDHSRLDCGVVGVDIQSGIVESHALLAEGPNLSISGSASIDLGAETLDLVILPEQKQTIFSKATPVKVSGNLLDPTVEAIPAKAAATRIGKIVLLPQVFVPLEVLSQGWRLLGSRSGSSPGCTKVLGRSVKEGFAFEGAQPQATN